MCSVSGAFLAALTVSTMNLASSLRQTSTTTLGFLLSAHFTPAVHPLSWMTFHGIGLWEYALLSMF
jgi:hypothetical protein